MLNVTNLTVGYGEHTVIHDVTFTVEPGTCLAILGRNGAGKTTLIHALAGLIGTFAGDVTLNGRSLVGLRADQRNVHGITLVPQGHRVFRSLTVAEHLTVSLRKRGAMPFTETALYQQFPILNARRNQRAGTLSGGEQQILALARALAGNGDIILMDEPTEGLDPARRALLIDTVRQACDRGIAVVLVEQRVDTALAVANETLLLRAGNVETLPPVAALRADSSVLAEKLGMTTR